MNIRRVNGVRTALAVAAVVVAATLFFDPASTVAGTFPGVIVAVYPSGKLPGASGEVLIRLSNGNSVMAHMAFDSGVPAAGSVVTVVASDSLLLRRRSYSAHVEPAQGGL